ncbi:GntR family transcriptional regulator [Aquabacter sp. CN5-332]|uniref:GntR family transcriptional regulator n=1 Tax=Aquabacter sp. CN5-332 TaxID=3156608 RepID=UPI0032B378B5
MSLGGVEFPEAPGKEAGPAAIQSGRRATAVYESLCESFRQQHFRPGERIVEDVIAERLGVSRTPVREALNRLRARGLIKPAEGGGFEVTRLTRQEVIELYAFRELLEGAVSRDAAANATEADIETLHALNARFRAAWGKDVTTLSQANRRFHVAIYDVARNRYLRATLHDLLDHLAILGGTTLVSASRFEEAFAEHEALIAAIAAHDAEAAEAVARRHVSSAQKLRIALIARGEAESA